MLLLLLLLLVCRHEIVGIVTDVGSDVKKFKPGVTHLVTI
jgi:D-arabinose 1-dehydrogenase-like Zn-dependent alcohol dehydrogenase